MEDQGKVTVEQAVPESYQPQRPGGLTNPGLEQLPPYPGQFTAGYQQQNYAQQGFDYDDFPPQKQPNVVYITSEEQQPDQNVIVRTTQTDPGPHPGNYLCLSIFSILFCLIFGIIAVVCSTKVNKLWVAGRHDEARATAITARGFAIAAIVIGVIVTVFNVYFRYPF